MIQIILGTPMIRLFGNFFPCERDRDSKELEPNPFGDCQLFDSMVGCSYQKEPFPKKVTIGVYSGRMDINIQESENKGTALEGNANPTPEVAVQTRLQDKDLLERIEEISLF